MKKLSAVSESIMSSATTKNGCSISNKKQRNLSKILSQKPYFKLCSNSIRSRCSFKLFKILELDKQLENVFILYFKNKANTVKMFTK